MSDKVAGQCVVDGCSKLGTVELNAPQLANRVKQPITVCRDHVRVAALQVLPDGRVQVVGGRHRT
jgi:hypothetical protein